MTNITNQNFPHLLKLKQIAAWQVKGVENADSYITARVPSLQRGAVWEPQQIEMLWDSIMRGFPIGSIVIAKKIEGQNNQHSPILAKTSANEPQKCKEASHHILDGQQRCNAISWGFVNPWKPDLSDDVVLWLDLKPGDRVKKNTTRKYLFRVTTKAHPWGFDHGDEARNLSAGDIEKFKDRLKTLHNPINWPTNLHGELISERDFESGKIKRPSPKLAMPYDAGFPVPVFLLFKYFEGGKMDWERLAKDEWLSLITVWTGSHVQQLDDYDRKYIEQGLAIADQAAMVIEQVPILLDGIDDIEQIFQRLNRQGTRLDNEELAYSLIKAYWPEVENKVSKLPDHLKHTTEARLVGLGVRVALTDETSEKIEQEMSVERIRNIFRPHEDKSKEDIKRHELIKQFIENGGLENSLKWIDKHILYDIKNREYGLPKYLRSSIAWHSRDVFAWLMLLAKRNQPVEEHFLLKKIIGLALTIHWFGVDKFKSINTLVKYHNNFINIYISDLNPDVNHPSVRIPLHSVDIEAAFQLGENSTENQLANWTDFWQGVVNFNVDGDKYQEKDATDRANKYGHFIGKLRNERELLVYAQRAYIENVFDGFDPSNKLMWKGHNRPWDYDHILPSQSLNAQGKGMKKYLKISQAWQQSIGNLVAVDFSFNRAAQDIVNAYEKYAESNKIEIFSNELSAFVISLDDTDESDPTKQFVFAAKNRLLAIYQEWFTGLKIEDYREKCL